MKKLIQLSIVFTLICFCFTGISFAEATSIVGKWKTIDDETNQPKSIVELYERDGMIYGKVIESFKKREDGSIATCDKCPAKDSRKDQPTIGMEIVKDLKDRGKKFSGGTILDPEKGKIYTCEMWIDKETGNLQVRGFIAFFFRTQTWLKVQ